MPALAPVLRSDGDKATPGIKSILFFCLAADILTFPVPSTAGTAAEAVTVVDDIVFKTGKKWLRQYTTREMAKVMSKLAGVEDCKGWENTLELSFPGNTPEMIGNLDIMKNSSVIFIAQDKDGAYRILGSPDDPALVSVAEADAGDKFDSYKGVKVTIRATGPVSYFYEGIINETPAA